MSRHSQSILKHLLVQDGQRVTGAGFKNSVLIQVLRELDFVTGNTDDTWDLKATPQLTPVLLFCSAVDLSGRILNRRLPSKWGENRQFFVDAAEEWYGMSAEEATALWEIRNFTSHQFNPTLGSRILGGIAPVYTVIDLSSTSGVPFIFTNSMIGTIEKAMSIMWHELTEKSQEEKRQDAIFIQDNCFFYSKHPVVKRKYHGNTVQSSLHHRFKKLGIG